VRIYLDSAVVIYTVEQVTPFAAAVDARLSARAFQIFPWERRRPAGSFSPARPARTPALPALLVD
jgi:hypothetical protein